MARLQLGPVPWRWVANLSDKNAFVALTRRGIATFDDVTKCYRLAVEQKEKPDA